MVRVVTCPQDTDEFDRRTQGYALANRINDIIAKPTRKRHLQYLRFVREGYQDKITIDETAEYRAKAKELLPKAIRFYEYKNETTLRRDQLFFHHDERLKIAAAPDAIEGDQLKTGITFHIRSNEKKCVEAIERGITPAMNRQAQIMMLVCQIPYWLHVNYWRSKTERRNLMQDDLVEFDRYHASQLETRMIEFLLKTRRNL